MSKKRSDILVLGATLFSMFFGAGNLIFPPALGMNAGSKWLPALIGFFLTGIGLPLLGVIASAKSEGDINVLGERVSYNFSKILGVIVILCIGPLLAIPRTGATTYEIGIQPLFPSIGPVVFAFIYFGVSLALVINPSNLVDKIGKVLTPALLILLALIIILGIINPVGEIQDLNVTTAFSDGFSGGYQTMDAFAALLFGGIIVRAIRDRGYSDPEEQINMTLKSGLIAVAGLTFVYGGLGYLGATASEKIGMNLTKVQLIMLITENSLKSLGTIGLSIVVSLACLTTSVGLISTVGQYFNELSKGKLSYKSIVIVTSIVSGLLSIVGVDGIVKFSGPLLEFLYPIVIVLILLTILFEDKIGKTVYKTAILFTTVFSFLGLFEGAKSFLLAMPLGKLGLAWLVPAMIGTLVGYIIEEKALQKELN